MRGWGVTPARIFAICRDEWLALASDASSRDPRTDPRKGDVLWARGAPLPERVLLVEDGRVATDRTSYGLTRWQERMAYAVVVGR